MFSVALLLLLLLAAGSCVHSIDLIQPDSMVVQPGQSLTISCQVSGYSLTDNSYATGWIRQREGKPMDWIFHRWGGGDFYQNNDLKNKFSYSRDTSAGTATITGQNMQPEDTAVFYCVRYNSYAAFDYWGKGTMVTVTSATPKLPDVFPLVSCSSGAGDTVTLGCIAKEFRPAALTFSWSKNGAALTNFIQYPAVQKDNFYMGLTQIQVSKQDWENRDQVFKCVATSSEGSVEATHEIPKPHYQSPTLQVLASSGQEDTASFSCFAKDFSPKDFEIKWLKDNKGIAEKIDEIKMPTKEKTYDNGTVVYSAASFLTVQSSEWSENSMFTCEFKGKNEDGAMIMNATVTKKPEDCDTTPRDGCRESDVDITITGPTTQDMFLMKKGTLVCEVKINKPYVTEVMWHDEKANELDKRTGQKGSTETIRLPLDITFDEWSSGIKRVCTVYHNDNMDPIKKVYERQTGLTQRPSVFMLHPVEQTKNQTVTLTCFVKDFYPKEVFVSWLVDDEPVKSDYRFSTTEPVENQGTYWAYSQLQLSLDQWNQSDVVYSCMVYHESLVNTTKAVVRSIGYRTFEKTNLININVPHNCQAH